MRFSRFLLCPVFLSTAGMAAAQTDAAPTSSAPTLAVAERSDLTGHFADQRVCSPRIWGGAEYLLWWMKDSPVPVPLVTTSGAGDFGVIGAPTTRLLIGNEDVDLGARHGGRFTLGTWLGSDTCVGVEASFFLFARQTRRRTASVDGLADQVIGVPFFDVTPGGNFGDPASENNENAFVFGAPLGVVTNTAFAGIATLSIRSQLLGTEANGVFNLRQRDNLRLDLLGGFRYVHFRERLDFTTSSPTVVPTIPGEFFVTSDTFDTRNDFYGGQLGARMAWNSGRLTVSATGKVALGVMHQQVGVNGFFATNDFNTPFGTGPGQGFPGGYFALRSNIGENERDRFGVVPEVGLNLDYQVTRNVRLTFGYTFLYLADVVRPGDQIDRVVNGGQSELYSSTTPPPGLQGGPARPTPLFRDSGFWAQGISFGVGFQF